MQFAIMKVHQLLWLLALLFVFGVSLSVGSKLPLYLDEDDELPAAAVDEASTKASLLDFHRPKSSSVNNKRISQLKCQGYARAVNKGLSIMERKDLCKVSQFPHVAAIGWLRKDKTFDYLFAGSLISELWVLSAIPTSNYRVFRKPTSVLLGTNDTSDSANGRLFKIASVISHPRNSMMLLLDISLVKLTRSVEFSINLMPACLSVVAFNDETPKEFYVASWEAIKAIKRKNFRLRKNEVQVIDEKSCGEAFNATIAIQESMICAGGQLKRGCKGDFGGPLQQRRACTFDIVGLTNFKGSCGDDVKYPGIFTRVSHYIDWIEGIVWPAGSEIPAKKEALKKNYK